ncbi:hypothetical protein ACFFRR_006845 [Megaselia abdita]
MDCRKITAQLLVDVACTVDYFNESCEIVQLTKDYIQVDHILLIENGLSPPKLFVKIPNQEKKIHTKPNQEWLSEYIEFNDEGEGESEPKGTPTVITKEMENDMTEIKQLLHAEIKENRQHKQIYVDLHASVQQKIDEISRKVSSFDVQTKETIMEAEEDSNFGIDSFSIDKSYIDTETKQQNDDHKFDLNSVSEYFPLTNHSEILAFENKVRREYDFKEKMIKTLYQVGGENARVACRKLAKLIFIDEILVEYSYEGAQSKKKFKEFIEIIEIIFLAVYNRFNDYTMEQHKSGLSDHLRYASSRLKKRKNAILTKLEGGNSSKKSKYDDLEIEYS